MIVSPAPLSNPRNAVKSGFTLIELSIVLVIIGLIVGGMLVGQDLIRAAAVRAQITQIEKYNTAANTFRGKYGYLPGDIKDPDASSFGFQARGQFVGEGDGNGLIDGNYANTSGSNLPLGASAGETVMFCADLSSAKLIEGGFNLASDTAAGSDIVQSGIALYVPPAKIGASNYVSMWNYAGVNYYTVEAVSLFGQGLVSTPGLSVQQAYSIDRKIDDGLPQTGNVVTVGPRGSGNLYYSGGLDFRAGPYVTATPGSSTTCYDNGNVSGATQQYSVEISNGANVNCALSFKMQAGD